MLYKTEIDQSVSTYNHQLDSYSLESVIKWDIIEHARKDTFLNSYQIHILFKTMKLKKK